VRACSAQAAPARALVMRGFARPTALF